MFKIVRLACLASLAMSALAHAEDSSVTVLADYTDFTHGYGTRSVLGSESVNKSQDSTIVIGVASGERNFAAERFTGSRFTGTVYHNWTSKLSTRTAVTASSNDPVFVRRELAQDVSAKVARGTVLTVGAKVSEYFGDVDASAWNLGGSYYFPHLTVGYKYTRYDVSGLGNSYSNQLTLRLKDRGSDAYTQLFLSQGTSLQVYEWLPQVSEGDVASVTLRRYQPINAHFGVAATLGVTSYDTRAADYRGVNGGLSLTYRW